MPHLGTNLTILSGNVAIGKLDEVKGILDILIQVINCYVSVLTVVLILTRETYVYNGQGFCANLLREKEILVEAKTIGLEVIGEETMAESIVPTILVQGTVLYRAERVLPVVAGVKVGTLNNTATGETEATGLHISQCLHEVLAQATLATLPSVDGEE
jgi:hypothetical protein